jgi:hypothetical protein
LEIDEFSNASGILKRKASKKISGIFRNILVFSRSFIPFKKFWN